MHLAPQGFHDDLLPAVRGQSPRDLGERIDPALLPEGHLQSAFRVSDREERFRELPMTVVAIAEFDCFLKPPRLRERAADLRELRPITIVAGQCHHRLQGIVRQSGFSL